MMVTLPTVMEEPSAWTSSPFTVMVGPSLSSGSSSAAQYQPVAPFRSISSGSPSGVSKGQMGSVTYCQVSVVPSLTHTCWTAPAPSSRYMGS